ncbi:DNRLRE domain-containing protein [Nocardiopsis listeri]|uniref:DNRLRE domain-containing protein n=1 Tax=Nocardiopsis listeri TaxID=53440 RepID=UPI000B3384C7|nr:DNRLRE domain-containing protein [Nocardiopsis listeri]
MRRSLARATAACAAHALALVLGTSVAPATVDEKPPAEAGDTASVGAGSGRVEPDDVFAAAHSGTGRVEVESASWTYVDRAFPDRAYDGARTRSVGIGHLEWDRAYTRRVLFRFPVESAPGSVVESAVLRAEVVWSYDCVGDSLLQAHSVDPFHTGSTWNDQPTARALLDTRSVTGGQASCPVNGGVEFDVTEAYRWAVRRGESHVHLLLRERDESQSAAWRRLDVQDAPPVLMVDHGEPRARAKAVAHDGRALEPVPSRTTEGLAPSDDLSPRAGESDEVRVHEPPLGGPRWSGGEPARFRRGERAGRPAASGDRGGQVEDTIPTARGPPRSTPKEDDGFSPDVAPIGAEGTRRWRSEGAGRTVPGAPRWGGIRWWSRKSCHRRAGHGAGWPIVAGARSTPMRGAFVPRSDVSEAESGGALRREVEAARNRLCAWAPHGRVPGRRRCAGSLGPEGPPVPRPTSCADRPVSPPRFQWALPATAGVGATTRPSTRLSRFRSPARDPTRNSPTVRRGRSTRSPRTRVPRG